MKIQSGNNRGRARAWDPRVAGRVLLALVIAMLLVIVSFSGSSFGMGSAVVLAQATPTPTPTGEPGPTGPQLQLLNPTDHADPSDVDLEDLPDISDKKDGVDQLYHLTAWTKDVPGSSVMEASYTPQTLAGTPLQEITIGLLERVADSADTWEFYWDIPDSVPEGTGTITVRLFAETALGLEQIAEDTQAVEMRHREGANPPSGDGQPASETVELGWPFQNGPLGFFKPKGGAWKTVVEATTSTVSDESTRDATNPLLVQFYYTTSAPGSEPKWKLCGEVGGFFGFFTGGTARDTCTLSGKDTPSMLTSFAATLFQDQNPESVTTSYTEESSDVHRIKPYVQDPHQMKVALAPLKTTDTGGTYRQTVGATTQSGDPHRCIAVLATVTDNLDRPVQGANFDIEAVGPSDELQFGDEDRFAAGVTVETGFNSAYKKPDQGNHSTEVGENCDRDQEAAGQGHKEMPVEGEQGDHNRPGGPDTKHRESVRGTGLDRGSPGGNFDEDVAYAGKYTFHLFSPTVGSTAVTAWVDDQPLPIETEAREADSDTLGVGEPTGQIVLQWLPAPITIAFDPVSDTAAVGSCNRYTVKVRGGTTPVTNINVDVHATGPNNDLDFCDPGDGTPRRAPDREADPKNPQHQFEDQGESTHQSSSPDQPRAQHTEGETDERGNFVIGITSPVSGDTTLSAWVDGEKGADSDTQDSGEPSARATKSWASSLQDAQVSFQNPSPYGGSGTRVSNKADADNRYHIVTRVDAVDVPGVELFIGPANGSSFTKIGDATRVGSTDTYEFLWDVNVPDNEYTLRAQITGTTRARDQRITVNKQTSASDPSDAPAFETVEITRPTNTQGVPFSRRETVIEGAVSDGAEGVDLFYTKVGAKDTPQSADWISCGFARPRANRTFSGTCQLQGSDQASQVTGLAAIAFDCEAPNCEPAPRPAPEPRAPGARESGDAHRVFGFEGRPQVAIEPAEVSARSRTCQRFVMDVNDESGQAIGRQNVDIHLTGPSNEATFCDPDGGTSVRQPPNEGGHTVSAEDQEGVHQDTTPYTKHIEGETNASGRFTFGVTSEITGDSQIFGWVDRSENDTFDGDESGDSSVVHWTSSRKGSSGGNENPECTISGDAEDNVLRGTPGDDVICGFGGNDTLIGRGGNDVIKAGQGRDILRGSGGNDVLRGGGGSDRIRGGSGRDKLYGNGGNDFLDGQRGRDTCRGGPGRDTTRSC